MSYAPGLHVLKFGSSVLRSSADLPWAVQEIYAHVRRGERVLAVVSAFAGTTDALQARAQAVGDDEHATAAYVATGELESAALLALALDRHGVPAKLLEPHAARLRTRGAVLDAEPASVEHAAFAQAYARHAVVVFPGFCGLDAAGDTTLLGRGGSDLTALFLARELGASCTLLKDVDGLYERDPALPGPRPRRYQRISWDEALRVGGKVVQPKTLKSARVHGVELAVRAIGVPRETRVGAHEALLERAPSQPPLRVALLGAGTVGRGVYERLRARPDLFEITRIAVRTPARHVASGLPADRLTTNPWRVLEDAPDVVVEAFGGIAPAAELVLAALTRGARVVTANKALLAEHGAAFAPWLRGPTPRLACSAAVGGAVPMLEALARLRARAPVVALRGVVNGTCNYVLDRLADGVPLAPAIAQAQAEGFAEADPSFDLSGRDAAHKLALLIRAARDGATGDAPAGATIEHVSGIDEHTPAALAAATAAGRVLRLVARWDASGARVGLEALAPDDPLAAARREQNRLEILLANGEGELLSGRGAGRAPTATAVVADLLDAYRERARNAAPEAPLSSRRAASA